MTKKKCFKCSKEKDIEEFYRHQMMKDGHLGKCKECTKIDSKLRYYAKHDEVREYDKKRARTNYRRQKKLVYSDAFRKNNPEKKAAHTLVHNRLRSGEIVRQPCEVCGTTENIQAHHDDYSKPLEVRWLCQIHHKIVHGFIQQHSPLYEEIGITP